MAMPSLNQSFDASLVDVQRSFSSTETATSGSSGKENQRPPDSAAVRTTRELTTSELYSQWASTYDTDGNFLQQVDSLQTTLMIRELGERVEGCMGSRDSLKVLDFGCGTGRTTTRLLQQSWTRNSHVEAWDSNEAMLEGARAKCEPVVRDAKGQTTTKLDFRVVDFTKPDELPADRLHFFDVLVSTLVLEHIPMDAYWTCVSKLLKSGGWGIVTNMHPDLGAGTQAGFQSQGVRLKGTSYVHGVQETIEAAQSSGMQLVGEVREIAVSEDVIQNGAVGERGRKWMGTRVWYGFLFRKM